MPSGTGDELVDSKPIAPRTSPGRRVVLLLLGLGLLAAAFAWSWNYSRSRRVQAFYGWEAAVLIRRAPVVEVFLPAGQGDNGPSTTGTRQIDISKAPGLLNARTSLLDDASYDWDAPADSAAGEHVYLRFINKADQVMVRIDFDARIVTLIPDNKSAGLIEKTAKGWRTFIARNVREE